MRKLLILPIIMAFCVADSGAFAAAPRAGGRPNSARAATTTNAKTTNVKAKTTGGVAARAAKKTTAGGKVTTTGNKTTGGKKANGARAAATQKVLNMGTKVKGATENTVVDEECQNAYYGCMDAFCMLDNASGGRCQCSDRNKELDVVLEEIMKLDQQTLAMATEGVERIQMGENADEIMARVKAATGGIEGSDTGIDIKGGKKSSSGGVSKARTLDLSAWKNNSIFSEDDDVFGETDVAAGVAAGGEFANKFGDELQVAASGVCVKQLPTQCKDSASFLQLTYGQRIRSDCTAYENSLKQQRNASQEKLATAQKALRDAALESFQNENKYDFGECVVRFKQCLQTTAECGEDYSGCVADTAILSELYGKGKGKGVETKDIKTGATTITISAATYDIFNNKKMMCTSVVKQCVNANKKDEVWQQVIKDLAPVIYTAEYNAASNNRMNCISTVVKCVQKACGSKWDDQSDNYDACLSDPNSINNYCKLEYNRCGDSDSLESVKSYVMAKLAALKVDKCTTDVKECLLSEDRCGPDYTGCIGLDSDSIVDLCPEDKLISCQDRAKGGAAAVREYISQIAQGLALNIDNKFATACQNAADAALQRICGEDIESEEDDIGYCEGLVLSTNEMKGVMKWQYCGKKTSGGSEQCYDDLSYFANDPVKQGWIKPKITGGLSGMSSVSFDEKGQCGAIDETAPDLFFCASAEGTTEAMTAIINSMNRDYKSVLDQIKADTTIDNCMNGRTVKGFASNNTRGSKTVKKNRKDEGEETEQIGTEEGRFPKLLGTASQTIGNQILNTVRSEYYEEMSKLKDSGKSDEMYDAITKRRLQIIAQELMHKFMTGKTTLCELSSDEFSTLMANPEIQDALDKEQDNANIAVCEATCSDDPDDATKYCEKPNFCSKPSGRRCDYGNAGTVTQRKTPTYDPVTNTCNVKVETFNCKTTGSSRAHRDKCKKWNSSTPDETKIQSYSMPKWNDKDSEFLKDGCK